MNLSVGEKRRETRRAAEGVVHVHYSDPQRIDIEGRLMDVSARGFRMTHDYVSLAAGQIVEFAHLESAGQARVMWNRVIADRVESGFLIVE